MMLILNPVRPIPGENTVDRVLLGIMTPRNQIPCAFFSWDFLPNALQRQALFVQFQDMVTQLFRQCEESGEIDIEENLLKGLRIAAKGK